MSIFLGFSSFLSWFWAILVNRTNPVSYSVFWGFQARYNLHCMFSAIVQITCTNFNFKTGHYYTHY